MQTKSFYELWDWNEAERLANEIYLITLKFSPEERYGLTSQLRSAAVSVFSNIAEGSGRGTFRDYVRFLINARGSIQFDSRGFSPASFFQNQRICFF